MKKFTAIKQGIAQKSKLKGNGAIKAKKVSMGNISNRRLMAIIAVLFILFVLFSGNSPIVQSVETKLTIRDIEREIEELREGIKQDCVVIDGIKNNKTYLIRYAREKLYFTQQDEDVYITEE